MCLSSPEALLKITKKTCDIDDDDDKRDKKTKLVTCSLQRDCRLAALGNKDCTIGLCTVGKIDGPVVSSQM